MKITVIKKATTKVRIACPWVVDDYSNGSERDRK